MTNPVDRISRRLKIRDLHLLQAVVQWKSMAKAASHLHLTQPAVSKAISELEHAVGVRLLDRGRHGIEPTAHGRALIRRGVAILDELRQGVSELEHLSDPTAGEVRVATSIPMAAGILPIIVGKLARKYPRIAVQAREIPLGSLQFHSPPYLELRERVVDLALGPLIPTAAREDFDTGFLFDDAPVVAVGANNRLTRRRAIKLRDLMDEPWCLPPPDSVAGRRCMEAFRVNGLNPPRNLVIAISVHLQIGLLATQGYVTIFPKSLMQASAKRLSIKALPIRLDVESLPIGIVTLRRRTINPAAQLFIEMAREVSKSLAKAR
jgi:DNA-binding transcriptional LysR family regulator